MATFDPSPGDDRGQTTMDFGIGAGVFLVAVVFAVGFAPGMLQPFERGVEEETVVVDRVANSLTDGMLGDTTRPDGLDPGCTAAFFDDARDSSDCRFDNSRVIHDRLGVSQRTDLDIELAGDLDNDTDPETLCLDGDERVAESDDASCEAFVIRSADPPDGTGSVVTARRTVTVGDATGVLVVRAW